MITDTDIQKLSLFIYNNPGQVQALLKKNHVRVPEPVTYPDLNELVLDHVNLFLSSGTHYNFIDPVSLGLAATALATGITTGVVGAVNQARVRSQAQALQLMQFYQNSEMAATNIQEMEDARKKQIILDTATRYKQGLDLINQKNQNQKKALIFFSVSALSMALFLHVVIAKKWV